MELIIILILILLNGIFSMSEIALISSRKRNLLSEANEGKHSAKIALKLIEDPDKFLSTIQIGITLIGILTGLYSGDKLAKDFAVFLSNIGFDNSYTHIIAQLLIVVTVTYLTILFGELLPKRIGMSSSTKITKLLAVPMYYLSVITSPVVWILSKSSSFLISILGINTEGEKVTEEEIKSIIEEGVENGEVQEVEHDIMDRALSLGDRKVRSIMTYRSDIVTIDLNMSNKEIFNVVYKQLFQVYPVTRNNNLDDIVGVVFLKDLFGKLQHSSFNIIDVIHTPYFIPDNMDIYKLLDKIRTQHLKYGLICDEYGNLQGIITIKDILEALVGDLPSEVEEPDIISRSEGGWFVNGKCPLYDFLKYFNKEEIFDDTNYNTLGGLILYQLEHIPQVGEKISWENFNFEVVDMDGVRIDKVYVQYTN